MNIVVGRAYFLLGPFRIFPASARPSLCRHLDFGHRVLEGANHFSGPVPVLLKTKQPPIEKLDFIIAGTQKAGTSALADFLEGHPKIKDAA